MFSRIKETVSDFIDDDCPAMAAALAYYTIFSLPPLLLIIVSITGAFFGTETVANAVQQQVGDMVGKGAATEVKTMLRGAQQQAGGAGAQAIVGIVVLLLGATTAFAQLQSALNKVWKVKTDPRMSTSRTIRQFLSKRLLSFGLILVIGFLLLVSLVLSAALSAAGAWLESGIAGAISAPVLQVINFALSLGIIASLFALMFKYMPDAHIAWRDVAGGAILTASLFTAGKFVLGYYFGATDTTQTFGGAASTMLILLWVYYSSMILLFGAEFTHIYALRKGRLPAPEPGAVHDREAWSGHEAAT
jgi:membrane protein